ncbi:unnamed protein product [Acanthosepion pharaonis]|uniref:Uncharacterized protein n=1 Tax=Acanthosepion pharaonis TaxID=158019 RepID=A0A812BBM0_ACAPH|nr:unnamed protein product [Sepia pharaonis]
MEIGGEYRHISLSIHLSLSPLSVFSLCITFYSSFSISSFCLLLCITFYSSFSISSFCLLPVYHFLFIFLYLLFLSSPCVSLSIHLSLSPLSVFSLCITFYSSFSISSFCLLPVYHFLFIFLYLLFLSSPCVSLSIHLSLSPLSVFLPVYHFLFIFLYLLFLSSLCITFYSSFSISSFCLLLCITFYSSFSISSYCLLPVYHFLFIFLYLLFLSSPCVSLSIHLSLSPLSVFSLCITFYSSFLSPLTVFSLCITFYSSFSISSFCLLPVYHFLFIFLYLLFLSSPCVSLSIHLSLSPLSVFSLCITFYSSFSISSYCLLPVYHFLFIFLYLLFLSSPCVSLSIHLSLSPLSVFSLCITFYSSFSISSYCLLPVYHFLFIFLYLLFLSSPCVSLSIHLSLSPLSVFSLCITFYSSFSISSYCLLPVYHFLFTSFYLVL